MPFKSQAQRRFLYAHPEKVGGKEALKEWSNATDFDKLPEKKSWKSAAEKRARSRSNGG
jgi:hypothetical protein